MHLLEEPLETPARAEAVPPRVDSKEHQPARSLRERAFEPVARLVRIPETSVNRGKVDRRNIPSRRQRFELREHGARLAGSSRRSAGEPQRREILGAAP